MADRSARATAIANRGVAASGGARSSTICAASQTATGSFASRFTNSGHSAVISAGASAASRRSANATASDWMA